MRSVAVGMVSELEGRGADWTEERGTSDEGKEAPEEGAGEVGGAPEASGRQSEA